MSVPRLLPLTLALATLLAPSAHALAGPYAGVVAQGETRQHPYDNNPHDHPCIQLATTYTVTLLYAPATDVLTLSAGGATSAGRDGRATVSFTSGVCTAFDVLVTGTRVERVAAYDVLVTSFLGGAPIEWG